MQPAIQDSPPQLVERLISYRPTKRFPSAFAIILPPTEIPQAGTGGQYLSAAYGLTPRRIPLSVLPGAMALPVLNNARDIASALIQIRNIFHLNMSEVAQAFNVSRPTAYAWLSGTEPRVSLGAEIWKLASVAEIVAKLGISNSRALIRKPIDGKDSILASILARRGVDEAVARLEKSIYTSSTIAIEASAPRQRRRVYTAEDISAVVRELE